MTLPLTREEAQRQIAELQRHIDSLPKNNHPPVYQCGMLFKKIDSGAIYMVVSSGEEGSDDKCLRVVANGRYGMAWMKNKFFYGNENEFEYLGHAKDLLTLKTEKPEVVVTDEMANKAWTSFRLHDGVGRESMKHVLTLALNGKL